MHSQKILPESPTLDTIECACHHHTDGTLLRAYKALRPPADFPGVKLVADSTKVLCVYPHALVSHAHVTDPVVHVRVSERAGYIVPE